MLHAGNSIGAIEDVLCIIQLKCILPVTTIEAGKQRGFCLFDIFQDVQIVTTTRLDVGCGTARLQHNGVITAHQVNLTNNADARRVSKRDACPREHFYRFLRRIQRFNNAFIDKRFQRTVINIHHRVAGRFRRQLTSLFNIFGRATNNQRFTTVSVEHVNADARFQVS